MKQQIGYDRAGMSWEESHAGVAQWWIYAYRTLSQQGIDILRATAYELGCEMHIVCCTVWIDVDEDTQQWLMKKFKQYDDAKEAFGMILLPQIAKDVMKA